MKFPKKECSDLVKKHIAKKDKDGKVDLSLLPPLPLIEIAKVYMFGAEYYGKWNWADGRSYSDLFTAMLRHAWKWFWGETYDSESDIHHLAHAAWYMLTLIQFSFGSHYEYYDDRPHKAMTRSDIQIGEAMQYRIPDRTLRMWKAKKEANKDAG